MATIQTDIINAVTELAEVDVIGQISEAVSCSMQFAGGSSVKKYLDGSGINTLRILCLGRSSDQAALSDRLNGICNTLCKVRRHKGEGWEIRRISVGTPPAPKGYIEDGVWVYSCILTVEYFYNNL